MSEPVLELRGIVREYRSGPNVLKVLEGADLVLNKGELVGLVGPSGSGKSTLLHTAGLLERAEGGEVLLDGESVLKLPDGVRTRLRREKLGFVYQFHHLLPEFNARDNVAMPLMVNGVKRRIARQKADVLLAEMGLESRADHQPGQLSGGEQQRVAIARALVNDPKLVIADEPTGNLDPTTTDRVFASLIRIARSEGAAVLVATHNMALTRHMDRVLTLQDGKLTTFTG
ncbi:ABC transporter ATP-binding protein [Henriciella mobilis]|uniref:ABC transporter ATP-binding protein n=1 Tax=Henriciella mobilis TaxID=2305467 RepID=A0A399RBR0_9PROT|nr:ABC transporter ATP-binding protein [Henriciella mobilis]RIJ15461.1 ABC transporter ATP-binding protein [Henriciella mobilis]RIJ18925.1 ABC transporter ATP-binding protein [Henriciella mobilis]RIJ28084.1 ABC transporter ATP-binding protein [Henriciella mobilis]